MSWTYQATKAGYGNLWRTAVIKDTDDAQATTFANRIIRGEDRYKKVQAATGVPWFFIGALHMRESSNNFGGVLHNGEHIIGTGKKTTLVPAGRGPFSTWEEAAVDALKIKNLDDVRDWPAEQMLFRAEIFNGLGYVARGINSSYVWAGTNHEQSGKYVADHVWDPNAKDTQLGVAAVLLRLASLRPDVAAALNPQPEKPVTDEEWKKSLADILTNINDRLTRLEEARPALPGPVEKPVEVKPVVVPPPPTAAPASPQTGLLPGLLGLLGTAAAAQGGVIAAPGGSMTGTLLPLAFGALSILGGTGKFDRILTIAGNIFSMLRQQPK